MSLSVSVPVNSAAVPAGTSPDAAAGVALGAMPEGGVSVFDILLQQIAMEQPAQAEAEAARVAPAVLPQAPAVSDDVTAALLADDGEDDAAEPEVPEADVQVIAQMPVNVPVVQPQTPEAAKTPELVQSSPTPDAKAAKTKPDVKFSLSGKEGSAKEGKNLKDAETADTTEPLIKDTSAKDQPVIATAKADPKAVLSRVRDAVTGTDPQPTQPATDPRVVSATAPDAASPVQPTAFSLEALKDTSGSYTATGASTTAGSNMSKAAVETLSTLSMQIHKKLEQGSTKFAIELYPADLGKVEVSLHIARDGKTTAHLTFDSPVTAASFSASEPELRQQLANAGLSVDRDSLSFSSRDGGGFGSAMAQDQQQHQQSQARQATRALDAARKVADDSDLNAALNTAMQAMRTGASTLALNLIV